MSPPEIRGDLVQTKFSFDYDSGSVPRISWQESNVLSPKPPRDNKGSIATWILQGCNTPSRNIVYNRDALSGGFSKALGEPG